MNPKRSLALLLSRSWSDWKLKLVAPLTFRSGLQNLISASLFLLLMLIAVEEFWRLRHLYDDIVLRLRYQPGSFLDRRRVPGCAFDHEVPGWNDLLSEASRRVPASDNLLMLPLGPDAPSGTPEQYSAHCLLVYEMFPRQIIRIYPDKKEPLSLDYLASIAETKRARYLILYRPNKTYNPPFAYCRFGEDLLLVDVKNEISCKLDAN